jgi:membrane-associated protease RseP (regulator of RpoE activity)
MNDTDENPPDPDTISQLLEFICSEAPDFRIYEYTYDDEGYYLYGTPINDPKSIIKRLWVPIRSMGYSTEIIHELGEYVLIIKPIVQHKQQVWIHVLLAFLTVITTMFFGSVFFFGSEPLSHPVEIFKGLPFTLAIMFILVSHEIGHYVVAKIHGVNTSLPYFIPFVVGTMGTLIKTRGPIPSRKALFDVGVAGPVAGLIVSIIATIIGLSLPPIDAVSHYNYSFSMPVLFTIIADLAGGIGTDTVMHPVAFAGWVGMLITMLNLIPSGQLDGGHMLWAMMGPRAAYISAVTPFILLSLGLFIIFVMHQSGAVWVIWGLIIILFSASNHPEPINNSDAIGISRMMLGIAVFMAGLLCATLTPIHQM